MQESKQNGQVVKGVVRLPGRAVGRCAEETPRRIGYYLAPGFNLLAFTSAIEALRVANKISGRPLYDWHTISNGGQAVVSSNRLTVSADFAIETAPGFDVMILCGAGNGGDIQDRRLFSWLRRLDREGARLGAISDGSFLLARAGLLDGYRSAVHWQSLESFKETNPDLEVTTDLVCIDGPRFTCAGGTAAIDLMLRLIEGDFDARLSAKVAAQIIHDPSRPNGDWARQSVAMRNGTRNANLMTALDLMENNLEEPLSCEEIAQCVGISLRQMERLFRRHLGASPRGYYSELRLQKADHLLAYTTLSVTEVAVACGFVSPSHFAKSYRQRFQRRPREMRASVGRLIN